MRFFLNDRRRAHLICDLVTLSMPASLAQELAYYHDDLDRIDDCMAFTVCGLAERCRQLAAATQKQDQVQAHQLRRYIEADMILFATYMTEIKERDLPQDRFPRMKRAVDMALCATDECKERVLELMGKSGMLH